MFAIDRKKYAIMLEKTKKLEEDFKPLFFCPINQLKLYAVYNPKGILYINLLFIFASQNKKGDEETANKTIRKICEIRDRFNKSNAIIDEPSKITLASSPQYNLLKKKTVSYQNLLRLSIFPIANDDTDKPLYPGNNLIFTISEIPRKNK